MAQVVTIFLTIVIFVGFAKVYLDWSGFEKRVREAKLLDTREARKTAIRIGLASAITGLALGLVAVVIRLSSPSNPTEEIGYFLYLAYAISCTIGWAVLVTLAFALKVFTLRSIYK